MALQSAAASTGVAEPLFCDESEEVLWLLTDRGAVREPVVFCEYCGGRMSAQKDGDGCEPVR